jgi:mycothiol system anti-sigma-R factor
MTCQEAVRHLYPFLDRALDRRKSRMIQRHVDRCRACCSKFEFERALKSLIREKARETQVPPRLRQRIASLIEAF